MLSVAAQFPANIGTLTRTVTYSISLETTAGTCNSRLYNRTDNEVVTGTSITEVATTAPVEHRVVLTVGAAAGNLKDGKLYEVDIWLTGGGAADVAICTNAHLEISYN